jgi:DNA-directed RNA polymerase specialized sigma subunit
MYQDTRRIRQKATVYLDEYEAAIITSLANYLGVPKAEVMRQMLMKEARDALGIDAATLDSSLDTPAG